MSKPFKFGVSKIDVDYKGLEEIYLHYSKSNSKVPSNPKHDDCPLCEAGHEPKAVHRVKALVPGKTRLIDTVFVDLEKDQYKSVSETVLREWHDIYRRKDVHPVDGFIKMRKISNRRQAITGQVISVRPKSSDCWEEGAKFNTAEAAFKDLLKGRFTRMATAMSEVRRTGRLVKP